MDRIFFPICTKALLRKWKWKSYEGLASWENKLNPVLRCLFRSWFFCVGQKHNCVGFHGKTPSCQTIWPWIQLSQYCSQTSFLMLLWQKREKLSGYWSFAKIKDFTSTLNLTWLIFPVFRLSKTRHGHSSDSFCISFKIYGRHVKGSWGCPYCLLWPCRQH